MQRIDSFAGQNWLITPAALAVNEPQPQNIGQQTWLLVLSGVAITNLKGISTAQWLHETLHIVPDFFAPLRHAVNKYSIPQTPGSGTGFQVEQWSPFAAISSVFNQNVSNNSGFAIDVWRPSPFGKGTDASSGQPLNNLFDGIQVDAAVRDSDAILFRVSYTITLLGKIVFTEIILT